MNKQENRKTICPIIKKSGTSRSVRKYVHDNKHFCFCNHWNMLDDGVSDLIIIPSGLTLNRIIISQLW